ncbi:hypothetical protein YC2023_051400 [Brassica napus]
MIFMDVFSGYNQILMHPEDQEKTSFMTSRGIYCYKVIPFGLKNAGSTYERLVNMMFADQIGRTMEVYIDDMLVRSLEVEDHISHLQQAFSTPPPPAKCSFGVSSGKFLGYIVTHRGIEANLEQIRAIHSIPSPKNAEERQGGSKANGKDGGLEQVNLQTLQQISCLLRNPQESKGLPMDRRVRIHSPRAKVISHHSSTPIQATTR